jgi:hypothetical protein
MKDLPAVARVAFLVVVAVGAGLAIFFYARTLREIQQSDLDPAERKMWLRRVLLLRGIGWMQWEQYRRKHGVRMRTSDPEHEGLNDAPPPGAE